MERNDEQFQAICLYQSVTRPPPYHNNFCRFSLPILSSILSGDVVLTSSTTSGSRLWNFILSFDSWEFFNFLHFFYIFYTRQNFSHFRISLSRFEFSQFMLRRKKLYKTCFQHISCVIYQSLTLLILFCRVSLLIPVFFDRRRENIRLGVYFSSRNRVLKIESLESAVSVRD